MYHKFEPFPEQTISRFIYNRAMPRKSDHRVTSPSTISDTISEFAILSSKKCAENALPPTDSLSYIANIPSRLDIRDEIRDEIRAQNQKRGQRKEIKEANLINVTY